MTNLDEDLERIARKLAQLRAADPELRAFGIGDHNYQFVPPLSEPEVDDICRRLGIVLPEDYRRFITKLGNGGVGPGYGLQRFGYAATMDDLPHLKPPDPPRGIRRWFRRHQPPCPRDPGLEQSIMWQTVERGEGPAALSRPFPYDEPFCVKTDEEQFLWETTWFAEGAYLLAHYGCAIYALLVLNGPHADTVWLADCNLKWITPFGMQSRWHYAARDDAEPNDRDRTFSFLDWYEHWLDRAILRVRQKYGMDFAKSGDVPAPAPTTPSTAGGTSAGARWSDKLRERFCIDLPADVVDWFDRHVFESSIEDYRGQFSERIEPERLLDEQTSPIWGGQMLPDTLPIVDNGCGDVLCMRFAPDGTMRGIIRWDHESGLWRPYGRSHAEALLCDVASCSCDARGTPTMEADSTDVASLGPWEAWAVQWASQSATRELTWPTGRDGDPASFLCALEQGGLAEVFCLRERCRMSLESGLDQWCMAHGGGNLARDLGVGWPEVSGWLFDTARAPQRHYDRLSRIIGRPIENILRQDWDGAADCAARAMALDPELSWTHGVVGYTAERKGDIPRAVAAYLAGLDAPGSSDDFLPPLGDKFVVHRLRLREEQLPDEVCMHPYLRATPTATLPLYRIKGVRQYWRDQAAAAESRGEFAAAYRCYFNAGWDEFFTNDMHEVLDDIVRAARKAGYHALHRIASLHRACL